ncbi:putative proton-coupled thiamine transporter YuaJ [Eggerthia catenaformis OT 569 = DSM 20559]|uniref:Putative proton-coupled thiamine transporter YuaJ n=1 Tax=Eggerthia catenaformis OT 569 = DSM 20559 TaxID=999415 RepID=M2PMB8_9FIRM|nr:ECF transporter S component [Eggerthia catenaformis]EMD16709.1 putative proton-coupled thiamine transporter YuaJ [Eggerthia catenaformis OT 569 = DSM 20559]OUC52630.1 proton-coupled thiamine transporter YuaJ [Eggerthia catenaformis]
MERKLNTRTMAYIALFIAMHILLEYVFNLVPELPQGGRITLSLLPIFMASYLLGAKEGILVGFLCSLMQFALGLAKFYGPWSVLLDYIGPLSVVGMAALIKNIKIKETELPLGIIITMILKYIIHVLSGALLFASYAPANMNPWLYSILYNLPYNLGTMILCFVVFTIIYPRMKKLKRHVIR